MCQVGDIILIKEYRHNGLNISMHTFVVIEDQNGQIRGMDFDFIGLVMSSFKNEKQKQKKLSYPGNFPFTADDQDIDKGDNGKDGFIKAEQFYYFKKDKINYKRIGNITPDIFNILMEFIEQLNSKGVKIEPIVDNL